MTKKQTDINQGLKMFFGFFMVLVYLGVALAMALNWLNWSRTPQWDVIRWIFAIVFAAYGLYRGYREIKGEHTYGMRRYEDDDRYSGYEKSTNHNAENTDE